MDVRSYGNGWPEARATFLKGDFANAVSAFRALGEKSAADSTERSFAVVHQGLALMFLHRRDEALKAMDSLGSGNQVSKFFSKEVALA